MSKKEKSTVESDLEIKEDRPSLTLSLDDQQLLQDVLQRITQASAEHSQVRYRFLSTKKEFDAIEERFIFDEKKIIEKLALLYNEQQSRLEMIGKRMKVPQNYILNLQTMSWEPPKQ